MKYVAIFIGILVCPVSAAPKPCKAIIVDVPSERRDWGVPIGNVKVTFDNKHSEMWTKEGRCILPKVSDTGLVGWTRYTTRNSYQEPVNSVLRIIVSASDIKDFQAGPFIEDWGFIDGGHTVVIKSRGRHGPANYLKYDIKTSKLVDSAKGNTPYAKQPEWAKPFADDRPPSTQKKNKPLLPTGHSTAISKPKTSGTT